MAPMHAACRTNSPAVVSLLLEAKVDPNEPEVNVCILYLCIMYLLYIIHPWIGATLYCPTLYHLFPIWATFSSLIDLMGALLDYL